MPSTPWHLTDKMKRGGTYRLKDGQSLTINSFDTMYVNTSWGTIYLPHLLNEMIDQEQFAK